MFMVSRYNDAFTLDVKLVLNENLGGILGGTQCYMGHSSILSECQLKINFSWQLGLSPKWLAWCWGTQP
jgi:hypothetical protein